MDKPRQGDCSAGLMDGKAAWWTTRGKIGLPPLAMVMGVGGQQQVEEGGGVDDRRGNVRERRGSGIEG